LNDVRFQPKGGLSAMDNQPSLRWSSTRAMPGVPTSPSQARTTSGSGW
jgi:hypothetical protein